jgi:hypothetical protein
MKVRNTGPWIKGEPANAPDFTIHNFGSILTLNPETDTARAWVDENIGRDNGYQPWYPDAIIIEPRYVAAIVEGIEAEGMSYA